MDTNKKELNLEEMEQAAGGDTQKAVPDAKAVYKFVKWVISWFD